MKNIINAITVISVCVLMALPTWSAHHSKKDIVDTAVSAGSFNTLVTAVKEAGLVETLKGEGPFTVFAPTDDAFAKIPEDTLNALLKDKEALTAVLTYHVVVGKVLAKDVVKIDTAKMVNGQEALVSVDDGKVFIDDANVVKTDIKCSNGVIHVIDTVLLPKDIVDRAASIDDFSTLVAAVKAAGLVDVLKGDGPFTVFAPTNEAFAALPEGTVESLLKPENKEKLVSILTYHVVPGKVLAEDVVSVKSAKTVQGQEVSVRVDGKHVFIDNAKVLKTDVLANNGVIHVIDSVILPGEKEKAIGMIENAIREGAPLFNRGHVNRCVDIYKKMSMTLLKQAYMPEEAGRHLSHALEVMNHTHDSHEKAWILRMGLDRAYSELHS